MALEPKTLDDVAVVAFMARCLPHILDGDSLEAAAGKVVARDRALGDMIAEKSERGRALRDRLCRETYETIRQNTSKKTLRLK